MRETFKKVINLDLTPDLKNIKNSTLLVWGENDKDTPLYMAEVMKSQIEDSGIVVIKNAGHFSYLDNSAQYCAVADNFLNSK
jgi:pimeloyl-ACP methyl ester carboxylesterase